MQVGRRTLITQLNYSRYAVNFFVNGDSELQDDWLMIKIKGVMP